MHKLVLTGMLVLLLPSLGSAQGAKFGIGVSGGLNIPVVQDDQGSGSTFGFRAIIKALPVITLEPNLSISRYGDPDFGLEGVTNDLEGSKLTSYGLDAVLGAPMGARGIRPFALVGLGFYKATRDQAGDFESGDADFGWAAGLGLAFGFSPKMAIDVRGKFNMIPVEGGSSKKSVFIVGGLNYYFGGK
jgi:opacity protein-like surface antigen